MSTLRDKRWVFFVVHAWNAPTDQRDLQRMTIQSGNTYARAVRSPNR
jgi:hypothetical protein